jgi:hypothetical protein
MNQEYWRQLLAGGESETDEFKSSYLLHGFVLLLFEMRLKDDFPTNY